jgi:hypothetical protein
MDFLQLPFNYQHGYQFTGIFIGIFFECPFQLQFADIEPVEDSDQAVKICLYKVIDFY